jgi:hypothetical protein
MSTAPDHRPLWEAEPAGTGRLRTSYTFTLERFKVE